MIGPNFTVILHTLQTDHRDRQIWIVNHNFMFHMMFSSKTCFAFLKESSDKTLTVKK